MLESIITTSEPSTLEKQARVSRNLISALEAAYSTLSVTQKNIFKAVWENPQGLTPQEVLDSLGTKAKDLLALNEAVIAFLTATAPTKVSDEDSLGYKVVEPNLDGTVVVTTTPDPKRVAKGLSTDSKIKK